MNIIHIISNNHWEPSERYALDLCRAMQTAGHKVTAVCRNSDEIRSRLKLSNITSVTAPLLGNLDVISPVRIAKLLREAKDTPTVIHVHRFADAVIASRARTLTDGSNVKIVLTRHITSAGKKGVSASAIYNDLDAMVFPTSDSMQTFASTSPGVAQEKMHVIHPATEYLSGDSAIQPVKDPELFSLVFAGNLNPESGIDTLVKAIGLCKDLPLRLVVAGQGQGPVVMPVVKASRTLGVADRIDWRGPISLPDTVVESADAIILPDKSATMYRWLTTAAATYGLRAIASDLPQHHEMLSEATTTFFTPGDAESLAGAIRDAYTHRAEQKENRADKCAFDTYGASMMAMYSSLFNR